MAAARTLDLGESLLVHPADLGVLLLQFLKTSGQRVRDVQAVILAVVIAAGLGILQRGFHLADSCDHVLGLRDDLFLLMSHKAHLIVQGLRQGCEQLQMWVLQSVHDINKHIAKSKWVE